MKYFDGIVWWSLMNCPGIHLQLNLGSLMYFLGNFIVQRFEEMNGGADILKKHQVLTHRK